MATRIAIELVVDDVQLALIRKVASFPSRRFWAWNAETKLTDAEIQTAHTLHGLGVFVDAFNHPTRGWCFTFNPLVAKWVGQL